MIFDTLIERSRTVAHIYAASVSMKAHFYQTNNIFYVQK